MQKKISNLKFKTNNYNFKITVIGGLYEYKLKDTQKTLIENEDKTLYKGKKTGKNKIVICK